MSFDDELFLYDYLFFLLLQILLRKYYKSILNESFLWTIIAEIHVHDQFKLVPTPLFFVGGILF